MVVGASLAGCTAARLYAQRGLSVALVEKHHDPAHYKRLCTHYIQGSARPTIERLGLAEPLEAAGAVHNGVRMWTRWGWIVPPPSDLWGYNVRRQVLDPLLRGLTVATPGVEAHLGYTVREIVEDRGRVDGVVARRGADQERTLLGRLVVGADGAASTVADLANVATREVANRRFVFFASYRGLQRPPDERALLWLLEPDAAFLFPNDDGVTVLGIMPSKSWLPAFDADRQGTFERYLRSLPEAPHLTGAEQLTPLIGTRDVPLRARSVAPRPGLALVGDAARTSDPLWGVGCGWALQSAEWLVDATAEPLLDDCAGLAHGVRAYRRRCRHLAQHDFFIADYAKVRALNPVERSIFAASTRDDAVARDFERFGTRTASALTIMDPFVLARTTRVNRAYADRAGTAPEWRPAEGVRRRVIVVDDVRCPMLEAGPPDAREAVVCVHGSPGSSEDFGHLVERVGAFVRAVAVDMPGFGQADTPADFPRTNRGYARHLGAVLDHLGIRRAHLVLHDLGGLWGLRWAADNPASHASVTMVNTGVTLGFLWHRLARIWQTPRAGEAVMAATSRSAFHRFLQRGAPRGLPRSYTDHLHHTMDNGARQAILALYRSMGDLDAAGAPLADVLRGHPRPALVVWGRHDPYLPLSQAYRQRDVYPDARIDVLDHSGHWPFVDDPPTFVDAVVPFLRSVATPAEAVPSGDGLPRMKSSPACR